MGLGLRLGFRVFVLTFRAGFNGLLFVLIALDVVKVSEFRSWQINIVIFYWSSSCLDDDKSIKAAYQQPEGSYLRL